jgi:hypothetical protein
VVETEEAEAAEEETREKRQSEKTESSELVEVTPTTPAKPKAKQSIERIDDPVRIYLHENCDVRSSFCIVLIYLSSGRHLAGRAQTLQDARKPMHTDPCTI